MNLTLIDHLDAGFYRRRMGTFSPYKRKPMVKSECLVTEEGYVRFCKFSNEFHTGEGYTVPEARTFDLVSPYIK